MTPEEIHKIAAVESSHWWYVGTREICFSLLLPHLGGRRSLDILDVGCGAGGNLLALRELGHARGIDIDPLCVEYCRAKGLEAELGSMADLRASAGSLDLVTLFDVLTQGDPEDSEGTLRRVHRALRVGGILAFRDPALAIARGAHDPAAGVRFRFSKPEVLSLLRATGFEPLRVTYLNTFLFPPVALVRTLQRTFRPSRVESDVKGASDSVNDALLAMLRAEKQLLQHIDFPFGISVFAVARKRADIAA